MITFLNFRKRGVLMNPVLKYRGGKSREIPRFLQYIPDDFNRYIEPFFGGGAVFFYLEPDNAIINDANGRLMTFYQQLRDDYPTMRTQLDALQQLYEMNQADFKRLKALTPDERVPNANEDLYYRMRNLFNHPDDSFLDGVLYFFINKTAYSGMIRYNNNGEYNVPFGRYPNLNTRLVTQQHSDLLQRAELFNLDYKEVFDMAEEDDFIFLDPPYDAPLMFEYNTWRAMTMLDGGNIKGNFNFDDAGQPLSTAAGNMPDIECDYDDFSLSVEVTLQSGQRQYESEGEPVARHYGQLKKRTGKDTYCLFIAPTINPATLAHFYGLNHLSIALYGGKSKIIPLELDQFMRLIENSYNYKTQPVPNDIRRFLDYAIKLCEKATDENHWRCGIQACVDTWLAS